MKIEKSARANTHCAGGQAGASPQIHLLFFFSVGGQAGANTSV